MKRSPTGNSRRLPDRGFTLIELILVLIILSLAMAVTYPAMSRGRTAFHLRAVSRDVISSLRSARETAVTEQKVMIVTIDPETQKLTITDEVGEGARVFQPPSDVSIHGLNGAGEEVTNGLLTIRFLPNGSSEDAQVLVKSETGAALRIVLDPITGGAQVASDQGEKSP